MKNKHLAFVLAVLMSMASSVASAHDFEVDGIYYNITSSSSPYMVAITYRGRNLLNSYSDRYTGSVTIPESVTYDDNTYSVTSIGNGAFSGCSGLTSVTIPNSVTNIDHNAFSYCSGLTSVTIPNSVTSIGYHAFYGCTGLTSITIPNSVTNIYSSAFYGTAWYNNQPDGLVYAGKVAFKYKGMMPEGTSIVLEEGTLGIAGNAFYGCSGLTSVTIPNSVTSIDWGAFEGTAWYDNQPDGLVYAGKVAYKYKGTMPEGTNVVLEEGTLGIAGDAFRGCSGLTSITIPNSVKNIGESAFIDCI